MTLSPPRPVYVAALGLALVILGTPITMSLGLIVVGVAVWMEK